MLRWDGGRRFAVLGAIVAGALLSGCAASPPRVARYAATAPSGRGVDVVHYAVHLEPDLAAKTLVGREEIDIVARRDGTRTLSFDAGALRVASVRVAGEDLQFRRDGNRIRVDLRAPLRAGAARRIAIAYDGTPSHGLEFHPERHEIYTLFATSQWMVCACEPGERATLDLGVVLASGLDVVGSGEPLPTRALGAGRALYRRRQATPVPAYLFGFAAGHFTTVDVVDGGLRLRYLATTFDRAQLARVFADTGAMIRFYAARAGVGYRGRYTQVVVAKTVGQEKAGFALLPDRYAERTLASTSHREWLIAHELAHQWWGNQVTCKTWGEFWLNEGFANFMAAAWLQHRFGDAPYRQSLAKWRHTIDALRAAGEDHPLVYATWKHPSRADRAVVYQKGAYVLALLREKLGERAFWRGIRDYTRRHYGRSVTSADFQAAMEQAAGRDLDAFFTRWVYGRRGPRPAAQTDSGDRR